MKDNGQLDRRKTRNIKTWLDGGLGAKFKSESAEIGQNDEIGRNQCLCPLKVKLGDETDNKQVKWTLRSSVQSKKFEKNQTQIFNDFFSLKIFDFMTSFFAFFWGFELKSIMDYDLTNKYEFLTFMLCQNCHKIIAIS